MRCAACNQPIDRARADDRGLLRCACGAEIELEERRRVRAPAIDEVARAPERLEGDPYRSPATYAEPSRDRVPLDLASLGRDDGDALGCPRCAHPLRALENETACRGCDGCGGVFVDAAALRRPRAELVGVVEPEASTPSLDLAPYVRCPVCREMMTRGVFGKRSGIVVDTCRAHGTWFDHGELVRALEFVERGGVEEETNAIESDDDRPNDPAVHRAAAELAVSLLADTARDARKIERWQARVRLRKRSVVEALLDLLD